MMNEPSDGRTFGASFFGQSVGVPTWAGFRAYANRVVADSNICIVPFDRRDVDSVIANPSNIIDVFQREAKHAMRMKSLDAQAQRLAAPPAAPVASAVQGEAEDSEDEDTSD